MQDRFGRGWKVRTWIGKLYTFLLKYNLVSRAFTALVIDPPKIKEFYWGGYFLRCNVPSSYMNGWWFVHGPSENNEMPTVRYLSKDIKDGDVFWEIGSAWGCYALIANRMAKLKQVVALEPEALNYAETVRNVYLNGFRNTLVFPVAASDSFKWSEFYVQAFIPGYGGGMTEEYVRSEEDVNAICNNTAFDAVVDGEERKQEYLPSELKPEDVLPQFEWAEQVIEMPLDMLRKDRALEYPTHMVMDVDGNELRAINGMFDVLRNSSLRFASIEIDEDTGPEVTKIMSDFGFRIAVDKNQRRGNVIYVRD